MPHRIHQRTNISLSAQSLLAAVLMLFLTGCYSVPFEQPRLTPLNDEISPEETVKDFQERLPERFVAENTLVFRFLRNQLAALGYAKIDRDEGTFEVLCLNHLGVRLFHISGDKEGNHHLRYAIPQLKEIPNFADNVGEDIREIYFNLLPGPEAEAHREWRRLVFREKKGSRRVDYLFGGTDNNLIEKRIYRNNRIQRIISFYEYTSGNDFIFPKGVVLHNPRYRYRLILSSRDVTNE